MEEVVMKKFIHEESPCVLQLCGKFQLMFIYSLKLFFVAFRKL